MHLELVESTGVLETHAWLSMNWTDDKLKWNPDIHNGISQLRVTADEVRNIGGFWPILSELSRFFLDYAKFFEIFSMFF